MIHFGIPLFSDTQDVCMSDAISQPITSRMRLLRTKLFVPQAHPDLVPRDRLLRRLDDACRARLVLLSAPAGFGKSTLLSTWIRKRQPRVGWVSLDARDDDPLRFWSYVVAALADLWPGRWETVRTMLQSLQPPPIEGVLTELLNVLVATEDSAVLILDDYHEISDAAIHDGLCFLLEHLPQHICLILSGRSAPPLPLARLRARRQLVELGAAELRFTHDEAEDFLNRVMGLALQTEDVATLANLTEGWVAGLQLAALSIQGAPDVGAFLTTFSGGHRYILDYLAQEILARQPPERSDFLLTTSILERMCGSLCDAITGREDGQDALAALERDNLFVMPLDRERRWYRYHRLFRDFLRVRLAEDRDAAAVAALRRQASEWAADHNDVPEAVEHALQAEDYGWAKELIERVLLDMFDRSELRTLMGWLGQLPDVVVSEDRHLSMAMAWALLATGGQDAVEPHLQDVERLVGARATALDAPAGLSVEQRGALAEISCVRATLCFNRADLANVIVYSEQALAYLGDDVQRGIFNHRLAVQGISAFNLALAKEFGGETEAALARFDEAIDLLREDENHHLLPLAISHLAQLTVVQGRLREAAAIYREALREVARHGIPSPLSGVAYVGLGTLLYQWNELDHAADHLQQGIDLGKPWSHWEILLGGYVGLACIDLARGAPDRARERLGALMATSQLFKMEWAVPSIEAYRALIAVRVGEVETAAAWAATFELPQEGEIPSVMEPYVLILVRVLIARGYPEQARGWLSRLLAGAERTGRRDRIIEALTLEAVALHAQGEEEAALASLTRALALGEPEGYVRVFLDEGAPVRTLLSALAPRVAFAARLLDIGDAGPAGDASSTEEGAAERLAAASQEGARSSPDLPEPLTDRELEVLALMAEGLTNQAIADRLFVSINTVKTHAKHIYEKLGVGSRAQAAVRGVELGLL